MAKATLKWGDLNGQEQAAVRDWPAWRPAGAKVESFRQFGERMNREGYRFGRTDTGLYAEN